MTRRPWTPEALAEVCRRYPHERTADIARDLGRSIGSIHGQANMLGLKKSPEYMREIHGAHIADAGARYRFNAGSAAWNKGIPGSTGNHPNTQRTQFKSGRKPEDSRNYRPVGSLRICKDGYLERKVSDDTTVYPSRRCQPESLDLALHFGINVLLVGHVLLQIKNPAQWPGLEMKRPNLERLGHVGEIVTLAGQESNYQSAIASICC